MEHVLSTGILDLILVILGFAVGSIARFRTPILLTMFLIKIVKWWFDTHPQGQEVAKKTNLNEEFDKRFGSELEKIENKLKFDKK